MRLIILAVGVCGVASAALLARYGLEAGMSAVGLSAWRLAIASAGLILFQLVRNWDRGIHSASGKTLPKADIWRVIAAGAFLALHFATWIASLEYVSIARSTLLVATSPLWAGLIGIFVPALRPRPIFWLGLAIAAVGMLSITGNDGGAAVHKSPAWLGDVLALVGAICIVPYLLLSQRVQEKAGTLVTVTWIYSSAAACLWLFLLGHVEVPSSSAAWLSIVGMALFAQLIGHSALNYSLQFFSAAQVATTTLLEPVFAAALAWILLQERVGVVQCIGGAVLLAGVWMCLRAEPKVIANTE